MPKSKPSLPTPDISYIVSAYHRPLMLPACLWSLAQQTHRNFEVIVTDNSTDKRSIAAHKKFVEQINECGLLGNPAPQFVYVHTAPKLKISDCYRSALYEIEHHARGQWYSFPCDDTYLVPEYGERMLSAAYSERADFLYCKYCVVGADASSWSGYRVWKMGPGRTIKTSLFVRSSVFQGFPGIGDTASPVLADWAYSASMRDRKVRTATVDEVLVVHN